VDGAVRAFEGEGRRRGPDLDPAEGGAFLSLGPGRAGTKEQKKAENDA
jgi:hypothetical protein